MKRIVNRLDGDTSPEVLIGRRVRVVASGCWEWTGGDNGDGYGYVSIRDRGNVLVHRFVYETLRGPVSTDLHLHHECQNRRCCNPDHLTPKSPSQHIADHHAQRRARHVLSGE